MRPRSIALGIALSVATLVSAAGAAASAAIQIVDFAFAPAEVSVEVGEDVTWTNADQSGHTVTADGGAFDSGSLGPNGTFTWAADAPGVYAYHCAFHPSMTGTVTVVEPAASVATPVPSIESAAPSVATDPPTDGSGPSGTAGEPGLGGPAAVLGLGVLGLVWVLATGRQRPWRVRGIGGRPRRPSTR